MLLHLLSDLHLECEKDGGESFLSSLKGDADILVLAGDIGTAKHPRQLKNVFESCSKIYSHTVYIPGNHEFYNTDLETAWRNIRDAAQGLNSVHVLRHSTVEIDGYRFIGDTAWFRDHPENIVWEGCIADFTLIKNYRKWVYEEQQLFEHYLNGNLQENDILITHHLTTPRSIHPKYKTSQLNRFFLCDYTDLITKRKPLLSLHGHTHEKCDYVIKNTRVIANPRGYANERSKNYQPRLIKVP